MNIEEVLVLEIYLQYYILIKLNFLLKMAILMHINNIKHILMPKYQLFNHMVNVKPILVPNIMEFLLLYHVMQHLM
jgi:hypothetical protein